MAVQKIKVGNSFNSYIQTFQIDTATDLVTLESDYNPHFGDCAELPNGTIYVRHSDDYQGDKWKVVQSGGGSGGSAEKRKITLVNEVDVTPQSAGNNLYIIQSNDSIMSSTTIEITYDDGTAEPQTIEAPLYENLIVTFDEQEYEVSIPTTISNEFDLVYGAPVTVDIEQGIPSIDFSEYPFSIIAGLGSEGTTIATEDGNNHSIKIEAEVEPIIPEGTFEITENGFYAVGQYANAAVDVHTGITPSGTIQITTNGVKNVTNYALANVNVPNTYAAADEGKVVSGGALVSQSSATYTQNDTYDTTLKNSIIVNVPNSYVADDEGKVVSNGVLVAQTALAVTENGTVDTTLNNFVTVNVSGTGENKPVKFIDYDGTLLYSYTPEEFATLEEMPALVSHTGMATATAWNWSLVEAKSHVAAFGYLTIGQEYEFNEIDIEISDDCRYVSLYYACPNEQQQTILWGDGTSSNYSSQYSFLTTRSTDHTYSAGGKYTIRIQGNAYFAGDATGCVIGTSQFSGSSQFYKKRVYKNAAKAVRLANTTLKVYQYVYCQCSSLKAISIPRSAASGGIESSAFSSCYNLVDISLPNGITSIPSYMCSACYNLSKIAIPSTVTTIGMNAFENCLSLERFDGPNIVYGISESVSTSFRYCRLLRSVDIGYVPSGCFTECKNLNSVTIRQGATEISSYGFQYCETIKELSIPSSVTVIGAAAFQYCFCLERIEFHSITPPTLSNVNTFGSINMDVCKIYVPYSADHSVLAAYQAAEYWSSYASAIMELPE